MEAPAYSDYSRQAAASTCLAVISAQQRCQFCETQEPWPAIFSPIAV